MALDLIAAAIIELSVPFTLACTSTARSHPMVRSIPM
jgi:hypothetical protein